MRHTAAWSTRIRARTRSTPVRYATTNVVGRLSGQRFLGCVSGRTVTLAASSGGADGVGDWVDAVDAVGVASSIGEANAGALISGRGVGVCSRRTGARSGGR